MCPSTAIQMLAGLVLIRFGVTSPSHTKPNPACCHPPPGRAAPSLASPATPDSLPRPQGYFLAVQRAAQPQRSPGPSGQGKPGGHSSGTGKPRTDGNAAGCLPTDGYTQVIRRTTTQPVRSIKGRGRGPLLPFPRPCVAHQLAEMRRTSVVRSHQGCPGVPTALAPLDP